MRIVNFAKDGEARLGVRKGRSIIDLSVAAPDLPRDLKSLLEGGKRAMTKAAKAADSAGRGARVAEKGLHILPPIQNPPKILCLGLNYRDHAIETGNPLPKYPVIFTRQQTTLAGHGEAMVRPKASKQLDFEAELAVIIGKAGRNVSRAGALGLVGGYSCFNDGSVRDYQFKSSQFTMGKNFDATGGFGPEMVTPDELPRGASGLAIRCRLNGKVMQSSNTDQHIFDVPKAIQIITEVMTLVPGDVIIMGTPSGVGAARKPQLWMKGGDVCQIEIDGIGKLANPIVNER